MQRIRSLVFLILLAVPVSGLSIFVTSDASALTGSNFDKANIIDDTVFYNSSALGASEIQSFLNSKVPSCDTNGSVSKSYYYNSSTGRVNNSNDSWVTTTRKIYGQRYNAWYNTDIAATPFTCLKNFKMNTPQRNAESGICGYLSAKTNRTAAQIISDVSSACGINPQSMVVLLQKEQGLITDSWPWKNQYQKATGYGCPDTAPCNSEYFGFFNQVYKAAWQFKKYRANPTNYNYVAGQNNKIYYNPNSSCGYSWVAIENQATAGLYNYTPYQPNKAALNNLYGSGDGCSAYGNRNFWRYFNDWFGSTKGTPFFRIGNGDAIYTLGANNDYYHMSSWDDMKAYGYGTVFKKIVSMPSSYISGLSNSGDLPLTTRFDDFAPIYLVDSGITHHFTSLAQYNNFGYNIGDEAALPSYMYYALKQGSDMHQVVKLYDGDEIYFVQNGKRSHISSWKAYTTLGSPVYASQSFVRLGSAYATSIPVGPPVLTTGTVTKITSTNNYGIWNGSELQSFSASVATETKIGPDYEAGSAAISQLPVSSLPQAGVLVKNSSGSLFVLNRGSKIDLAANPSAFGASTADFIETNDTYLARFKTTPLPNLIRTFNTGAVYKIASGGQLQHIFSLSDFIGLGYKNSDITNVIAPLSSLLTDSGIQLMAPGKLVRVSGQPTIYVIDGSFSKVTIPSLHIFKSYGFDMGKVQDISAVDLSGYTTSPKALEQTVKDADGAVWLVDRGVKRKVSATLQGASSYNIDVASLYTAPSSILNEIPSADALTELLKSGGDAKVYKIENGTKRWFSSLGAFTSSGSSWNDVRVLSSAYVDTIPSGSDINP